jgi:S-adenosylmethionine synthetase
VTLQPFPVEPDVDRIFTSESVTRGHPDKLCDQLSDAAVDAYLAQDPAARAVIEAAVSGGVVFLAARHHSRATVDLASLARRVIAESGYTGEGFNARNCAILTNVAEGFDREFAPADDRLDEAAMDAFEAQESLNAFGFACDETPALMPLPIMLAHRLARRLDQLREEGLCAWLAPDCKAQVSVGYENGRPAGVHSVTVVATAREGMEPGPATDLRDLLLDAFDGSSHAPGPATRFLINPEGSYITGGPAQHAGLTGRKPGIDTYGDYTRQSGSALSGKDPSRIDRIGAYAARHAARNVVASGLANRCEVHIAYGIGQSRPISIAVDTFGTGRDPDERIARTLGALIDFRPAAILKRFALRARPAQAASAGFFRVLAVYGHVGRNDLDLPWEKDDYADALRPAARKRSGR